MTRRPRRWRRWLLVTALIVSTLGAAAWVVRERWLGPLIARAVVQTLHEEIGGRWSVARVSGTLISNLRIEGLTALEAAPDSVITQAHVESITFTYRWWRFFGTEKLTAIDGVVLEDVALTIDSAATAASATTAASTTTATRTFPTIPWAMPISATGTVTVLTPAGALEANELHLDGRLDRLHLDAHLRLAGHQLGKLRLAAEHHGPLPTAGWNLDSHVQEADEPPLHLAVAVSAATPQLSATLTAGEGTRLTCATATPGVVFSATGDATRLAPALRRVSAAIGVSLPDNGRVSLDGTRADDGTVSLAHGRVDHPAITVNITAGRWHPDTGLLSLADGDAQIRPTYLKPSLARYLDEKALLTLHAQAREGRLEVQLTSADLPLPLSAEAQLDGHLASAAWRSAALQVQLTASADGDNHYRAQLGLDGSWAALHGNLKVQAARVIAGTWQANDLAAQAQLTMTAAGQHPARLEGQWTLTAAAIRASPTKADWSLASSGQLHADEHGLQLVTEITTPLVAQATLTSATPFSADGAWLTGFTSTPLGGQWQLSDLDLAQVASLLPERVHLDGHARGHGHLQDLWQPQNWSAVLHAEHVNLGGLPPLPPLLDIEAAITVSPAGVLINTLSARAGGGQVQLSGSLPLPQQPGPLALSVVCKDALIFQRPDVRLRADAAVQLTGTWAAPALKGDVHLTDLVATTPVSWFGGRDLPVVASPFEGLSSLPPPWNLMQLDLHLTGGQDPRKALEIRNNVVVARLAIDVTVAGKVQLPVPSGEILCRKGRLVLPFSAYAIDSAALRFNPADPYDPLIEATASTQVQGYQITAQISGTLRHPHVDVSSSPPLAPEDALVLASTGRLPAEMRRDGTSASAISVALPFVGRELQRWVLGDGFADDGESILDRFVIRYDEERSQRGLPSVRLEYQLYDPWYLYGERDLYEAYNLGLMWRWIFADPARAKSTGPVEDERDDEPVADWRVVPAAGVDHLPVSASKLLATVPARQRRGSDANQPAQIASAAQRMVDRLHEAGYPEARVQPTISTIHPERIEFAVTPGNSWTITASRVHGAPTDLLATLDAIVAKGLPRAATPTPSAEIATRAALRQAMRNAGYALAEVRSEIVRDPQAETNALVTITIEPGLHYRFATQAPTITGELDAAIRTRLTETYLAVQGKDWTRRQVINLRAQLLQILHLEGYTFAQVVLTDDEPALLPNVLCSVQITPGAPVIVQAINLSGFHYTSLEYVRHRLQLPLGTPLRNGEPEAALGRLRRSGVARSVKSTVTPVGLALPGMQPELQSAELNIIAEEAPPRSVELAAGYGSYEGARGSALYRDSNLFGWGRTWELGGNLSQRSHGAHTRIIDHDLLGIQRILSVTLSGGWRQEPSFDRTSYASEFSLRAPLTDWLDLRTTYTLEAERASERAAVVDDSQDQGFVLNGVLNTSLLWDGRDDRQLPTRGGLADVGFGISDPALGSQISYIEWSTRLGWVLPVVDERLILATQVAGIVRRITDGTDNLPIQYRLFLGGSTTVRSFGLNELSPVSANGDALGGLTAGYANVELRAKVSGKFHVAAFYDVGKVSERSWTLDGALGQALGGGLRYHLPIGPLRVDAAYNPGERWAADQSYAIEGAIGFTF